MLNTINVKIDLINNESINKCCEYSKNKIELKKLLSELKIYATFQGYYKYFEDDKDKRNIYEIEITRNDKIINFTFGISIQNTKILNNNYKSGKDIKNIRNDFLYSILSCISCDYFIDNDFQSFCSDFGYNEDSIKALETHKKCIEQSKKLKKIFNENEIECLPS